MRLAAFSSPLQCRQCAQRRCSRLVSETIRKCWSRFHFALNLCTLLCFTLCMDMHGFTLVYIYTNVLGRVPRARTPIRSFFRLSLLRLKNMQKHMQMLHWGHLALKMAVLTYSGAARKRLKSPLQCRQGAQRRCSSLLSEITICSSKVLVSDSFCSEPLHSALLYSVHGYARVHTSILYIYIYIYMWRRIVCCVARRCPPPRGLFG